jgi:hypothetical protein
VPLALAVVCCLDLFILVLLAAQRRARHRRRAGHLPDRPGRSDADADRGEGRAGLVRLVGPIALPGLGLAAVVTVVAARRALAEALLAFGADIGAEVAVEGVESAAERAELSRLGCRLGQGHRLGRPQPMERDAKAPVAGEMSGVG